MSNRTRLLTSSVEADINNYTADGEISTPRNYGSIEPQSSQEEEIMDDNKTTLRFLEKIGFSLGHVFNDLCAAIW